MATATVRPRKPKTRTEYRLRPGFRVKAGPAAVGETIEALKRANGGEVTPPTLIEEVRPSDHPLHDEITWDDRLAARKCREGEARYLIRSYEIVTVADDGGEESCTIANVCVTTSEGERAYVSAARAMNDEDLRAQVVDEVDRMLRGVVSRYRGIPGLAGLLQEAVERVLA